LLHFKDVVHTAALQYHSSSYDYHVIGISSNQYQRYTLQHANTFPGCLSHSPTSPQLRLCCRANLETTLSCMWLLQPHTTQPLTFSMLLTSAISQLITATCSLDRLRLFHGWPSEPVSQHSASPSAPLIHSETLSLYASLPDCLTTHASDL
jgi:hypothetical protein